MCLRDCLTAVFALTVSSAWAFSDIPRASAEALGVTKGKSFDEGVVFVNGKYLPPPYVVERWGTGLRINGRKVSGQIIDWTEFLKTQSGVKVTRTETPAGGGPTSAPVPELAPEPGSAEDDTDTSLDDLFDDDVGKKPKTKAKTRKGTVRKTVRKPAATTSYALDGAFVPNDASKALLQKINSLRSEIDRTLRLGGFVCFGNDYPRISGDERTALRLLEKLPDIMKQTENEEAFSAAVHDANLELLTGRLCRDLFRNRIDYLVLRERREAILKDKEWKKTLKDSGIKTY